MESSEQKSSGLEDPKQPGKQLGSEEDAEQSVRRQAAKRALSGEEYCSMPSSSCKREDCQRESIECLESRWAVKK